MHRLLVSGLFGLILLATGCARTPSSPSIAPTVAAPRANLATTAAPRDAASWQRRNNMFNRRAADGQVDLIFVGDSITQRWAQAGEAVWREYYADRRVMNLGISGDRTQHVLWRLQNGNLEGIAPKAAVILIGTNNHRDNTADEIADGVEAIVRTMRLKLPETKLLVMGILPRGGRPNESRRKLAESNQRLSAIADGSHVFFMDIGTSLMNPDQSISPEIMPDYLHLSERGYEIWAEAIEPTLRQWLGDR